MACLLAGKKDKSNAKKRKDNGDKAGKATPKAAKASRACSAWPPAPPMPTRQDQAVEYMGGKITAKNAQNKFRIYIPAARAGRVVDLDRMFNDNKMEAYRGCVKKIQEEVTK